MSDTNPSSRYFTQNAARWDSLRAGYFGEEVRQAAISRAYLLPEMTVADVGAGTGFLAAGLAPLVKRVYALDGSEAMLEVARENLSASSNVIFQQADGQSLPLEDQSVDAALANMYLHHCPDPAAAIREMARILKPGGRLVITDMDRHAHEWMREEMSDVWLGFDRDQVRGWLREAGLVNAYVEDSDQCCCAQSQTIDLAGQPGRSAQIRVFVAAATRPVEDVESAVQESYSAQAQGQQSCCASGCDCGETQAVTFKTGYMLDELQAVPGEAANISLGCGNPTAIAALQPGETVLDIGSGGGIDCFLSARKVGESGRVIGVDMTPAMLERARKTAEKNGYRNVTFLQGTADRIPVEDDTVDVIISNCVINLTRDKGRVFAEAARVLKYGGRLEVSDMVTDGPLPTELRADPANWAGCVYGALPENEYVALMRQAGFGDILVRRAPTAGRIGDASLYSITVSAKKGAPGAPTVLRSLDREMPLRPRQSGCCG